MAFVLSRAYLVDENAPPEWSGTLSLTDLRVTPGGGFQIVWDTSPDTGFHQTSYRIFDPAGQPLTEEIADGSYSGDAPAIHLQQSIQLDDGTILKVEHAYNTSAPGGWLVLQLYDESGVPLGEPIFSTGTSIGWGGGGLAQLPNRDVVFVGQSYTKVGESFIFSWLLDNTSPDLYAPMLTGIAGADGAAEVPTDGTIVVSFNELIELAPAARIDLKTASGQLVDSFDVSDDADLSAWVSTLTISPSVALDPGTHYLLEFAAGSVLDPGGNAFAGGVFHFTTAGEAAAPGETTAPTAIDFFPAAGSHMLPPDWSLGITFSETVRAGSGSVTLQTAAGELVQTFSASDPGIQFLGAGVIIDPAADLHPGTTYRLTVSPGAIQDLAGNAYAGVTDYSFTTAGEPPPTGDTTAPVAIDFFPAAGSNMLPPDWSLGISFDEDVKAGSGTITLQTAAGQVVQTFAPAGDPAIQFVGSAMIIDPAADLLPGTAYQLVIAADAVVDLVGNAYGGVSGHGFTTAG